MSNDGKHINQRIARIQGSLRVLHPSFSPADLPPSKMLAAAFAFLGGPDGMTSVYDRLEWVEGVLEAAIATGGVKHPPAP